MCTLQVSKGLKQLDLQAQQLPLYSFQNTRKPKKGGSRSKPTSKSLSNATHYHSNRSLVKNGYLSDKQVCCFCPGAFLQRKPKVLRQARAKVVNRNLLTIPCNSITPQHSWRFCRNFQLVNKKIGQVLYHYSICYRQSNLVWYNLSTYHIPNPLNCFRVNTNFRICSINVKCENVM